MPRSERSPAVFARFVVSSWLARRNLHPLPAPEPAAIPAAGAAGAAAAGGDDRHGIVAGKNAGAILLHRGAAAEAHGVGEQPAAQVGARVHGDRSIVVARAVGIVVKQVTVEFVRAAVAAGNGEVARILRVNAEV